MKMSRIVCGRIQKRRGRSRGRGSFKNLVAVVVAVAVAEILSRCVVAVYSDKGMSRSWSQFLAFKFGRAAVAVVAATATTTARKSRIPRQSATLANTQENVAGQFMS